MIAQDHAISKAHAERMAREAAAALMPADPRMIVTESPGNWVFTFLPRGRVRGGGVEVTVSKSPMKVVGVMGLQ